VGRDYKQEYENYHSSPKQKARRAARNKARAEMVKAGRATIGDGKDVAHLDNNPLNNSLSNLKMLDQGKNRSFARTAKAKRKRV
jgi:hypothetical protein|tara:strand:+ start:194 stop:445 length:252 start_codon:yes stop_codon:yes gene_type:complete